MNSSQLKILAMVAMLLDHIAWILFPNIKVFNIIGRIAFPIFCYMISEGYIKTKNKKKYLSRLILIAVISQIPFILTIRLAFGSQAFGINTIFDLILGLISIWIYDKKNSKYSILAVWILSILGFLLGVDGDFEGVWMIYFFYKYHDDFKTMTKRICMLVILSFIITIGQMFLMGFLTGQDLTMVASFAFSFNIFENIFALLALIPIKYYNGKKGPNLKWMFYIFYPTHLLALYAIRLFAM